MERGGRTHPLERHETPDWLGAVVARQPAGSIRGIDLIVEPSAGSGALLRQIAPAYPGHFRLTLIAVEIDPALPPDPAADEWHVSAWEGFAPSMKDRGPWHAIGNPPWSRFYRHVRLALDNGAASVTFIGPLAGLGHKVGIRPAIVTIPRGRVWSIARECAVYTFLPGFGGDTQIRWIDPPPGWKPL